MVNSTIMKKRKLIADLTYDFELLGIIARIKDFKLAWHLNETGLFHFVKLPDVILDFSDNSRISISVFEDRSELYQYNLIQNKLTASNSPRNLLVLPELREFDFFLKLRSSVDDFDLDGLISSLRKNPAITYLVRLDLNKIKNKENLVY